MTHGYDAYREGKPVVVTAALTGGVHGKEANPNLPETPDEIGAAAAACERAGNERRPPAHPAGERRAGVLARAVPGRDRRRPGADRRGGDPALGGQDGGARGGAVRAPADRSAPEMASLDVGPLNRYERLTGENTQGLVRDLHAEMRERGIKPELEAFNDGHPTRRSRFWRRNRSPIRRP